MENWYISYTMARIKQEEIRKSVNSMRMIGRFRSAGRRPMFGKKHVEQWLWRKFASRFLLRSGKLFIEFGSSLQKHSKRLLCMSCDCDKRVA